MVLGKNFWMNNFEEMKRHSYNYKVIKTDHFKFDEEEEHLEMGIHIWNLCVTLKMINNSWERLGVNKKVDYSILFDVLKALDEEKPFDDNKLKELFNFNREIELVSKAINEVSTDLAEHIYIESRPEMMLLGFGFDKQEELLGLDKMAFSDVDDQFFQMKYEASEGKISFSEYKKKGLELLEGALNEARRKKESKAA